MLDIKRGDRKLNFSSSKPPAAQPLPISQCLWGILSIAQDGCVCHGSAQLDFKPRLTLGSLITCASARVSAVFWEYSFALLILDILLIHFEGDPWALCNKSMRWMQEPRPKQSPWVFHGRGQGKDTERIINHPWVLSPDPEIWNLKASLLWLSVFVLHSF